MPEQMGTQKNWMSKMDGEKQKGKGKKKNFFVFLVK